MARSLRSLYGKSGYRLQAEGEEESQKPVLSFVEGAKGKRQKYRSNDTEWNPVTLKLPLTCGVFHSGYETECSLLTSSLLPCL